METYDRVALLKSSTFTEMPVVTKERLDAVLARYSEEHANQVSVIRIFDVTGFGMILCLRWCLT